MRDLRSNEDETLDVVDGVVLECEGVGIYQSILSSIAHHCQQSFQEHERSEQKLKVCQCNMVNKVTNNQTVNH